VSYKEKKGYELIDRLFVFFSTKPAENSKPILILYGTEYGASREIAYKLEKKILDLKVLFLLYMLHFSLLPRLPIGLPRF